MSVWTTWLTGVCLGLALGMTIGRYWPEAIKPTGLVVILLASIAIGYTVGRAVERGGERP